jgi:peptidyl-prolyl cis-trans isomerase SurA
MWLRAQGLSEPVIHRQMERQMMAEEYIRSNIKEKGIAPGFATLRTYYDHHPEEFKMEDKVKWLDIFINTSKHAAPQAAYDHAESIRRQAASGADFVALAKKYDNGLAAGTNGVGVGSTRGKIQPEDVETTVWALQPGQVSTLIQTPVGYHIVKVVEREYAGQRPFDAKAQADIRKKIMEQFRTVEYDRMVEDLWRKGAVQVMEQH